MDEFASACVTVCDRVLPPETVEGVDPAWLAYVRDAARLTEATRMTPCVSRLVTSDLHPSGDRTALGRFAGGIPPLGRVLPDLGEHEPAVRRLVMVTIAYGYFAMIDAEAIAAVAGQPLGSNIASRSAEQVWPYWLADMSTGKPLAQVAGKKEISRVRNICGASFYQGLLELGLVGRRRRRVPDLGRFYAQAGMLLRVLQSETFIPGAASEPPASPDRWPFEEMPTE